MIADRPQPGQGRHDHDGRRRRRLCLTPGGSSRVSPRATTRAAHLLQAAFAPPAGFAPRGSERRGRTMGGARRRAGVRAAQWPRHFSPADPRQRQPTAGWDPLEHATARSRAVHRSGRRRACRRLCRGPRRRPPRRAPSGDRDRGAAHRARRGSSPTATASTATAIAAQLRQTVLLLVNKLVGECRRRRRRCSSARIEAAAELLAEPANRRCCASTRTMSAARGALPATIFAAGDAACRRAAASCSKAPRRWSRTAPNCGWSS